MSHDEYIFLSLIQLMAKAVAKDANPKLAAVAANWNAAIDEYLKEETRNTSARHTRSIKTKHAKSRPFSEAAAIITLTKN
jgi:6,7-dimethyl-8-ribityllumazine synthase